MKRSLGFRMKKYRVLIPLVFIGIVYYFIFNYIPIIWGFLISVKDFKVGSTISGAPWVGLENYIEVIRNPEMKKLLINTLRISVARLIFTFIPPILLTLVIFDIRNTVFKKVSQTIVYIPHFFSWVIIYGIVYESTIKILNHFSHNGLATYDEMMKQAKPYGFLVSYDGMTVEF